MVVEEVGKEKAVPLHTCCTITRRPLWRALSMSGIDASCPPHFTARRRGKNATRKGAAAEVVDESKMLSVRRQLREVVCVTHAVVKLTDMELYRLTKPGRAFVPQRR